MENIIMQNQNEVVFEGLTTVSALINSKKGGKNDRKIIKILFDKDKCRSKSRELSFLKANARNLGYELLLVSSDEIDRYTSGNTHGGIVAVCEKKEIPSLSAENIKKDGIYYIFEGVEDPYNFGYMIRSVYAAGADGIILSHRNWLSAAAVVAKSSAGTSELIDTFLCEPEDAVDMMQQLGFKVICAGIRDSKSIYDIQLEKPLLVIVGGEKRGISRKLLDRADEVVRIDYGREFRGSLPSVAATSVIAFEILRKTSEN